MFKLIAHPGAILRDELDVAGISPTALARAIAVPPNRISQIIAGKRSVSGDTALRLGHWFGTGWQFWPYLQMQYDLAVAEREAGAEIAALPRLQVTQPAT